MYSPYEILPNFKDLGNCFGKSLHSLCLQLLRAEEETSYRLGFSIHTSSNFFVKLNLNLVMNFLIAAQHSFSSRSHTEQQV